MYAVIQTGGKQYRVAEGETLRVEKLSASPGDKLSFSPLLFADDGGNVQVGKPEVSGITVEAEVLGDGKGEKIVVFKYKRRKGYARKQGHRQGYTEVRIDSVQLG